MLKLLDITLLLFHIFIIIFNLFGWIFKRTRPYNLGLLLITGFSWGILGIKYGFGYCFLVDIQWKIKEALGETNLPYSFTKYLLNSIGLKIPATIVDKITLLFFLLSLLISIFLNIKDFIFDKKIIKR